MNLDAHDESLTGTSEAIYRYLVDCNFSESQINGMHLYLAAEYVYEARPRFWRDLTVSHFLSAIEHRFPNWRDELWLSNGEEPLVTRDIKDFLRIHAFDEANAELLLALPPGERPQDRYSAFEWICAELARRDMTAELEFARCDNVRCGEGALEIVERLEQAAKGVTVKTTGMYVASYVRDDALARMADVNCSSS